MYCYQTLHPLLRRIAAACAGIGPFFRADWSVVTFCAGIGRPMRPENSVGPLCAGMGYHFRRGMEKCSRLRSKMPPNPPGTLRGTVLRRNEVSFSARKEKLLPPARENTPKCARIAPWHPSAQEWGIFFCAEWEIVAACT